MRSGSACKVISLPCPNVADRQFTRCGPFSMRSSTWLCTGCPWRYLPANFPPWQTVFYHFRRLRIKGTWTLLLRALHRAERERQGRHPDPSAESRDSQSVKTVEESSGICGYDAHKHIKGRKRHILVDTLGIPISIYVTPADTHDTRGARCLLAGLKFFVPRLKKIWADAAYRGQELAQWCQATGDWELEVVERPSGTRGFSVVPASDGSWSEHSVGFLVTEE